MDLGSFSYELKKDESVKNMENQKELLLIRHAKSSWDKPLLGDRDRPLNKRGKRNIPVMGERLSRNEWVPDLVVTSPAKRARKTARGISRQLRYPKKHIRVEEKLYTAEIMDLYTVLRSCSDQVRRLFLVGHNFVITDFANDLASLDIDNIPTCGLVAIRFPVSSWTHIEPGCGELVFFDYPKKAESSGVDKV